MSEMNFVINAEEIRQSILDRVEEGYWDEETAAAMEEFASNEDTAVKRLDDIITRFDFEHVHQALESCEADIISEIEYDISN